MSKIEKRDLFDETFDLMEPDEGLLLVEKTSFPASGSLETVKIDLSKIVPLSYIMAYGYGAIRENGSQPLANPLELDELFVEVRLQRDAGQFEIPEQMVLKGEGRINERVVGILSMAFFELYVMKPTDS